MKHLFCYCILLTAMALMLGSCARRQSHQAVWMRQQLMQLKADDQADTLHTDTTLARRLVYYYEHEGDKTLLPEAYYYAGRIFYDRGDMPEALSLYQRAADVLSSQSSPDNHLASVCYSQMGYVFMYQDLFEEGEDMFRHAIRYAELARDTSDLSYCWRDLATVYEMNKQYDKELHCLQKAKRFAEQANDTVSLLVIESYLAAHYVDVGAYEEALRFLRPSLDKIHLQDSSAVYSVASDFFFHTHQDDSALHYLHQLETVGNVYGKRHAYELLFKHCLYNGRNPADAKDYFEKYMQYSDSVKHITQTEAVARAQSLYNFRKKESENNLLMAKNYRKQRAIIFITALFVVTSTILVSFILYYRRNLSLQAARYRHLQHLREEYLKTSAKYIENCQQRITELESQLRSAGENAAQEEINSIERERDELIAAMQKAQLTNEERKRAMMHVKSSSIYRQFLQMANDGAHIPSTDQWRQLQTLIDQEFNQFTSRLLTIYHFSEQELRINMLRKIEIEPTKIATLLGRSKNTISSARSRQYKKVFGKDGSVKDWDDFILSL